MKYSIKEAVKKLIEAKREKFDATVEMHINLNTDPKKQDQQIRFTTILPAGTGKSKKVAVMASEKVPNADLELTENDIKKIEDGNLKIGSLAIEPIEAVHGNGKVTGYRFEKFAYVTDVSEIPEKSLEKLTGLDVLVLGALRYIPHVKHFSIDQALHVVKQLKPQKAYFTHMCHDIEHEEDSRKLPAGVEFAFDGLEIEL